MEYIKAIKDYKRLYLRYLILYLVFSILVISCQFPIYLLVKNDTRKVIVDKYEATLSNSAGALDRTISELTNAINVIRNDQRLVKFCYENYTAEDINPIEFNSCTSLLNSLLIPNNLIGDASIIFDKNIVLTRQRSFVRSRLYNFYPDFIQCNELSYMQWAELLRNNYGLLPEMTYQSSDYGTYKGLTFSFPLYSTQNSAVSEDQSLFVAILPTTRIVSLLMDQTLQSHGYLKISSDKGENLFEFGAENKEDCILINMHTPLWLLDIDYGIPKFLVDEEMKTFRRILIALGISIFIVTFVLIPTFAYRSFRPLTQIIDTMISGSNTGAIMKKQIKSMEKNAHLLQEYRALDESIQDIDRSIDDKNRIIQEQQSLLKYQVMDMALRNGLFRPEELNLFITNFGQFPKRYRLSLFFYNNEQAEIGLGAGEKQYQIQSRIRQRYPSLYTQGFDASAVLLLLPVEDAKADDWNQQLALLREDLNEFFGVPFSFTISDIYTSPVDLVRAYQQIQCIKVYSAYNRYSVLENAEAAKFRIIQLPLGIGELQIIYNALCNGNDLVAVNTLTKCIHALPEPDDYVLHKHMYTMLSNLLIQLKLENPTALFDTVIPTYSQSRDKLSMDESFSKAFREICDQIHSARQSNIDDFSMNVMQYIDDNIQNSNLCVNTIIDKFDISGPTLQKIVKKAANTTFSGYVEAKRLSLAYMLLSSSNIGIQEIAERCGFSSSNSFYKVFKRKYTFSPSSVRDENAERKSAEK